MKDVMGRTKAISERLKKDYHAQKVILFGFFKKMMTTLRIVSDFYRGLPISPIVLRPEELEERKNRGNQFIT